MESRPREMSSIRIHEATCTPAAATQIAGPSAEAFIEAHHRRVGLLFNNFLAAGSRLFQWIDPELRGATRGIRIGARVPPLARSLRF